MPFNLPRPSSISHHTLVGIASFFTALLCTNAAHAAPVPAAQADAFVDQIGVNIHVKENGPYNAGTNNSVLTAALSNLGVRHVRDGLDIYNWPISVYQNLAQNFGIHCNLILGYNGVTDKTNSSPLLDIIKTLGTGVVDSIEPTNEPNIQNNSTWLNDSIVWQKDLWNKLKTNPTYSSISSITLMGPSLAGNNAQTDATNLKTSFSDSQNYMQAGNIHPYPGGWQPENTATFMHADLPSGITLGQTLCSTSKPVFATETGYTNASGQTGAVWVSENASGIYLPRLFLNNAQHGIVRTFWYDLFNDSNDPNKTNPEANFGLYNNDGVTIKPTGNAMKNLIGCLSDPGPSFTPASFDYTLSSNAVSSMLFQKRNGEFWLAIWQPASLWDNSRPYGQKQEITPPPVACTVTFNQTVNRATTYDNLDAASPTTAIFPLPASLPLSITARVTLIRIEPATMTAEAEAQVLQASSGDTYRVSVESGASGGANIVYESNAIGDSYTCQVQIPQARTYNVTVGVKKWNNRGMFGLSVAPSLNGVYNTHGPQNIDLYSVNPTFTTVNIGLVGFGSAGQKSFKFTVTGKNVSSAGDWLAIDSIILQPQ